MNDERQPLIRYRLDQAEGALRQAALLADGGEWDGVVNRGYYAMFYAALALLLTKGLGSSKHSGVLSLVDREFVRPGHLPIEMSRLLHEAFNLRQRTDYQELAVVGEERARQLLQDAGRFVSTVKEVIITDGR